ncbi:MAG: VWA domain-containing protein [Deltaproteobacteria bacterium]|nr:VWA domain-containing protein [Deltaproteobacteria bacterium]
MLPAHHIRTSVALGAASATVIAALLLHPRSPSCPPPTLSQSELSLSARLVSDHVVAGEQDLVVTIKAPDDRATHRPPLSVAVVIDRSGSMSGDPLTNAKAAADRLVDMLDERDAFTIIAYSSTDEIITGITRATPDAKQRAHTAIANIWAHGGTCISCGINEGANELMKTPIAGGLSRMVLISDGQANEGIYNRDDLAQLAANTAAHGVSLSAVGVGLDFDEMTMMRLARVGHGNYYYAENTRTLGDMFAQELGGLTQTVAADLRLDIKESATTHVVDAYGYPLLREGGAITVPVADLRAGEVRKVVLRVMVTGNDVAALDLGWRRVSDGAHRDSQAIVATTLTTDPLEQARTIDRVTLQEAEAAHSARIVEEAARTYETQGADAAQQVLERHMADLDKNGMIDAPTKAKLEDAEGKVRMDFAKKPAPAATKSARAAAYELAQ